MEKLELSIFKLLDFVYNKDVASIYSKKLISEINLKKLKVTTKKNKWDENDVFLITYGDSICRNGEMPLASLHSFLNDKLKDVISIVHILPYFPFSSDDGFSVIDYYKINPELGDWDNIIELQKDYKTMYDFVVNHISQHSEWFQQYKNSVPPYDKFFIEAEDSEELNKVVRPRSLPLLTEVETKNGIKKVWTTFSEDQIDLNFANPECMYQMMCVLIEYMHKGATVIRLDAIAFLWKQIGTNCLHLPQTHQIVKLMRIIAEAINPNAIIITETNVPNIENLSYFGDNDEAHAVYQFSLPPLLLHGLYKGDSSYLTKWAKDLPKLPGECTFFNFTASHDGIGVRPLEGILSKEEINKLAQAMQQNGGHISTKRNQDGTDSPYEMNITYFDALKKTINGEDNLQAERFLCSQTIMLSMKGIPAFYIHSLTATPNYYKGVEETGRARSINRMKWDIEELSKKLENDTLHKQVFEALCNLVKIRKSQPAFHPNTKQEILNISKSVFAIYRKCEAQSLLSISNITKENVIIDACIDDKKECIDIISGEKHKCPTIVLKPYQTVWLCIS